jgi:hypothetical protein
MPRRPRRKTCGDCGWWARVEYFPCDGSYSGMCHKHNRRVDDRDRPCESFTYVCLDTWTEDVEEFDS